VKKKYSMIVKKLKILNLVTGNFFASKVLSVKSVEKEITVYKKITHINFPFLLYMKPKANMGIMGEKKLNSLNYLPDDYSKNNQIGL